MKQANNTTGTISGFTPGKWEVKTASIRSPHGVRVVAGKRYFAISGETQEEAEANAALIAAAPDLLRENEELREAIGELCDILKFLNAELTSHAKETVKKAMGLITKQD